MSSIRKLDRITSLLFGTDSNPRLELFRIFGALGIILDPINDPFNPIEPRSEDFIDDLSPDVLTTYFIASFALFLFSL
jgi:hypothetical protein